jgi:hypothetical protein
VLSCESEAGGLEAERRGARSSNLDERGGTHDGVELCLLLFVVPFFLPAASRLRGVGIMYVG